MHFDIITVSIGLTSHTYDKINFLNTSDERWCIAYKFNQHFIRYNELFKSINYLKSTFQLFQEDFSYITIWLRIQYETQINTVIFQFLFKIKWASLFKIKKKMFCYYLFTNKACLRKISHNNRCIAQKFEKHNTGNS